MGAIWRGSKQFSIDYESDKFNRHMWDWVNQKDGCYRHKAGMASTLKSAKSIIRRIRKEYAEDHPRNFWVYDCYGGEPDEHAPIVYRED